MVALGHRYVVVCMSFMAQLRCVVYSLHNFQYVFCVCWCGKLRLA